MCFLEAFATEVLRPYSRQTVKEYGTQAVLVSLQSDEHEGDRVPLLSAFENKSTHRFLTPQ
jgi:hypothetical protein